MNTYYIKERNMDMTYIELRLLLYVDCPLKYEKITKILNFLNNNGFLAHLTIFYSEDMRAENIPEKEDVMSLTIDMRKDTLRFKFWNGIAIMWLFHTDDLLDALSTGREKFSEIYDKYEPVTEVLFNFKKRWSTSIYHISYEYPLYSDVDVIYNIIFTKEVEKSNFANKLLEKINKEIIMLGHEITDGLKFELQHSYKKVGCSACEEARKRREENENKE